MSDLIHLEVNGQVEVSNKLDELPSRVRVMMLRRVMKGVGQPIVDAAQSNVGGSGILRGSIGMNITSKDGGRVVRCFVGPKRGIMVAVDVHKGGLGLPPFVAIPTRYAHLVEFGHEVKDRTGKVIGHVGPKPFMRPAWIAEGGEIALYRFSDLMSTELKQLTA